MVDPSPVTSNGTDITEIEDEDNGDVEVQQPQQTQAEVTQSPATVCPDHCSLRCVLTKTATTQTKHNDPRTFTNLDQ